MRITLARQLEHLEPYKDQWDCMAAGVPTRSWGWLANWWRTFGQGDYGYSAPATMGRRGLRGQLFILCVMDDCGKLIGLAPWYVQRHPVFGRVIRWLGSGMVCSDYLSLLCEPGREASVASAIAEYLWPGADRGSSSGSNGCEAAPSWDLLELEAVEKDDLAVSLLVEQLARRGCAPWSRPGPNCWRIALPEAWEEYLSGFSRKRRNHVGKMLTTYVESGRASLRWADDAESLCRALDILIDLHQRRRQQLGEPGCFASPAMTAFVRRAAQALLSTGQLAACWLELDGRPVAAEYLLLGSRTVYSYQSGMAPEAIEHEPGKLMNFLMIRWAIQRGYRAYDLMRGDEPYKQALHAEPVPTVSLRLVPPRLAARVRDGMWRAARRIKHWLVATIGSIGSRRRGQSAQDKRKPSDSSNPREPEVKDHRQSGQRDHVESAIATG